MPPILFFSHNTPFTPHAPDLLTTWLQETAHQAGKHVHQLQYIFCDDPYLHDINQRYLQHDTLTDIITFDYTDDPNTLEGDLYISVDTVQANAHDLHIPFLKELARVMVHGLLHLVGYDDQTPPAKARMRREEDQCLAMPTCQAWLTQSPHHP